MTIYLIAATLLVAAMLLAAGVQRSSRRLPAVVFDAGARAMLAAAAAKGRIRIIATEPQLSEPVHRADRDDEDWDGVLFLEVTIAASSSAAVTVRGVPHYGHRILAARATTLVPAIAAVLLAVRDTTGLVPTAEFGWARRGLDTEAAHLVLRGHGLIAARARHLLVAAEPDQARRPTVRLGP